MRGTNIKSLAFCVHALTAPASPEPIKLVIGTGAIYKEKVETNVLKLRRVSRVRGDRALTEMRQQQRPSARVLRPSAAVLSSLGLGAGAAASGGGGGGGYTFSTTSRKVVKSYGHHGNRTLPTDD